MRAPPGTGSPRNHASSKRYIFGHSLGGGHRGATWPPKWTMRRGSSSKAAFTSIADVVGTFKWGWLPMSGLITQRFDAARSIEQVKVPVLVVHGSADRLISAEARPGAVRARARAEALVEVEGGSHHSTNAIGQAKYREALADLFGLGGPTLTVAD